MYSLTNTWLPTLFCCLLQGISKNQLSEMKQYNVQLVVPKAYLSSFPQEYRTDILILEQFVNKVTHSQL
ncbi:type II restriction endonuclease [uncultured Winogradskyella sp.]|uniref:type II restriction endonuclease n=1 Tax=uncultured Winogradskyella sp. TaxID=395353 RepID=UPI00344D3F9C